MKKEDIFQALTIDGEEYHWRIRHASLVDVDVGLKGLSISVACKPERTRELILDFPFSLFGWDRSPKQTAILAVLGPAIRAAVAAGWEAESRGRPFRFNVPSAEETT